MIHQQIGKQTKIGFKKKGKKYVGNMAIIVPGKTYTMMAWYTDNVQMDDSRQDKMPYRNKSLTNILMHCSWSLPLIVAGVIGQPDTLERSLHTHHF